MKGKAHRTVLCSTLFLITLTYTCTFIAYFAAPCFDEMESDENYARTFRLPLVRNKILRINFYIK